MLHKWVTEHKRSLKTAKMLSLRKNPSLQTNFLAFPAHFLFHVGHGHHTASQRLPGRVQGHLSCGTWQFWDSNKAWLLQWPTACPVCQTLLLRVFSRLSHFHNGSAVLSQQMWIVCSQYGFCWTVLRGFIGSFYSSPDLTPFTLDKHNTKEKRKFYIRR